MKHTSINRGRLHAQTLPPKVQSEDKPVLAQYLKSKEVRIAQLVKSPDLQSIDRRFEPDCHWGCFSGESLATP